MVEISLPHVRGADADLGSQMPSQMRRQDRSCVAALLPILLASVAL
jgi:hypothetical protein